MCTWTLKHKNKIIKFHDNYLSQNVCFPSYAVTLRSFLLGQRCLIPRTMLGLPWEPSALKSSPGASLRLLEIVSSYQGQ